MLWHFDYILYIQSQCDALQRVRKMMESSSVYLVPRAGTSDNTSKSIKFIEMESIDLYLIPDFLRLVFQTSQF